jgi:hypothetical protein
LKEIQDIANIDEEAIMNGLLNELVQNSSKEVVLEKMKAVYLNTILSLAKIYQDAYGPDSINELVESFHLDDTIMVEAFIYAMNSDKKPD